MRNRMGRSCCQGSPGNGCSPLTHILLLTLATSPGTEAIWKPYWIIIVTKTGIWWDTSGRQVRGQNVVSLLVGKTISPMSHDQTYRYLICAMSLYLSVYFCSVYKITQKKVLLGPLFLSLCDVALWLKHFLVMPLKWVLFLRCIKLISHDLRHNVANISNSGIKPNSLTISWSSTAFAQNTFMTFNLHIIW